MHPVLASRIEIDAAVCRGLGKLPGETLRDAALRVVRTRRGSTQRRVAAHCILNDSLPPWENMQRAAMWLAIEHPETTLKKLRGLRR